MSKYEAKYLGEAKLSQEATKRMYLHIDNFQDMSVPQRKLDEQLQIAIADVEVSLSASPKMIEANVPTAITLTEHVSEKLSVLDKEHITYYQNDSEVTKTPVAISPAGNISYKVKVPTKFEDISFEATANVEAHNPVYYGFINTPDLTQFQVVGQLLASSNRYIITDSSLGINTPANNYFFPVFGTSSGITYYTPLQPLQAFQVIEAGNLQGLELKVGDYVVVNAPVAKRTPLTSEALTIGHSTITKYNKIVSTTVGNFFSAKSTVKDSYFYLMTPTDVTPATKYSMNSYGAQFVDLTKDKSPLVINGVNYHVHRIGAVYDKEIMLNIKAENG